MSDLQRTDEWYRHRLGKVTASNVSKVLAKTKSGPAAIRSDYMTELLIERLTGEPASSYVNAAMQWGIDQEARARAVFSLEEGLHVEQTGLVDHPTIKMFGASPDGLVGDDGVLEIKCPNSATHWDTLSRGVSANKYKPQIMAQLSCTGRKIAHFVSFDPRYPAELMYFHATIERDDKYIADMEKQIVQFLGELDEMEKHANQLKKEKAA